ncbi:UDP-N-acetylmuramate dehydrogenase, partial [Candidatus Kaiserbacteria bacterium]|nr:UDP-N-acetylmuramate dehydrogenase [Candidatus Kaiserbacteria bacterium]
GKPPLVLGGGSNLLISDAGYRGLVIVNKIKGIHFSQKDDLVVMTCGAGEVLDEVIAKTVEMNYWGLENLSSIPGTIGATPIQNVGAYGVEVSSLINSVTAINLETDEEKVFSNLECDFGYRDSFFKTTVGKKWVVTEVSFNLSRTPRLLLEYKDLQSLQSKNNLTQLDIRNEVIRIRSEKFPDWRSVGTAGSFFKNPIISKTQFEALKQSYSDIPGYEVSEIEVKISLGWILDKVCNLKGFSKDGVSLYKHQALVLVNESAASAEVINNFAKFVAEEVYKKTNVTIEREVLFIEK